MEAGDLYYYKYEHKIFDERSGLLNLAAADF
jgi:hypothetical protein